MNLTKYNYAVTQHFTGAFSSTNCAPACVAMALRFQKGIFTNVQAIRDYGSKSLFWRVNDVQDSLLMHKVTFDNHRINSLEDIEKLFWVNYPRIVLININMWHIPRSGRFNKPYRTFHPWWGHWLVIVGEEGGYFKVLDPYTSNLDHGLYDKSVIYAGLLKWNREVISVDHTESKERWYG